MKQTEEYTSSLVKAIMQGFGASQRPRGLTLPAGRHARRVLQTEVEVMPTSNNSGALSPEDQQDLSTIRAAVSKLHTNLGHPSNQALARAIRLTGGSDLAISCALELKCSVCDRLQTPSNPAHLPGKIREAKHFGDLVAIGLFTLADS